MMEDLPTPGGPHMKTGWRAAMRERSAAAIADAFIGLLLFLVQILSARQWNSEKSAGTAMWQPMTIPHYRPFPRLCQLGEISANNCFLLFPISREG
jgi:hypothetical protein